MPAALRASPNPIRLVYILAASHSGSTLLAMLLNAHRAICSVGEIKATSLGDIGRYRCSCRRWIMECPFWNRITRALRLQGMEFDISASPADIRSGAGPYVLGLLRPLHRGPILEAVRDLGLNISPQWRLQLKNFKAINAALMNAILMCSEKQILVDSSKIGIRLKYLLQTEALDVKIIRMVRDGRAVSLTYTDPAEYADARVMALRGGGSGGDRFNEALSMGEAAMEWRRSNEEAEALLRQVERSRWISIRYEELCLQTEKTLKTIFDFLGMDPRHVQPDFRSAEHHVIGNGMRLDSACEIRLDERWKKSLSSSQLKTFQKVAGRLNSRLGYD